MTQPLAYPLACTEREAALIAGFARGAAAGNAGAARRLPLETVRRLEPGSTVWIREPFALHKTYEGFAPLQCEVLARNAGAPLRVHYAADGRAPADFGVKRFARSMPRSMSRLTLAVTAIERQPLQAITEAEARAAGFVDRQAFGAAWDALCGKPIRGPRDHARAWAENPEVVVIRFTAELRNVDARPVLEAA